MCKNDTKQLYKKVTQAICICLFTGCTTVPVTSDKLAMIQIDNKEKFSGDLPQAIMDVEDLRKKYLDEVVRQSNYREGIANTLIPLTAWALYKGITPSTDATNKLLAKAGVGGAALYGWGNYALSTDRQMIYLAGNDTLGCSIAAMRPYLFTSEEMGNASTPDSLLGNRKILSETIDIAKLALANYEKNHQSPALGNRKNDLAQARADLTSALEVLSKASRLKADVDMAGAKLRSTAQNIQNQVTIELVKAQPDLASITAITRSLLDTAPQFVGGRTFKMLGTVAAKGAEVKGDAQKKDQAKEQEINDWLAVVSSMRDVSEASRILSARLNYRVELSKSVAALETCKFQGPASDFRIEPDLPEIELAKNQSASFSIYGGTGMPRVSLTGIFGKKEKDEVATVKTQVDSGVFQATVTIGDKPGTGNNLHLDFADGSGRAKRKVNLVIRDPEQPAPAGESDTPTPIADATPPLCKPEKPNIDGATIKEYQKKLGAKETGEFDKDTCNAIKACAIKQKIEPFDDQSLSDKVFKQINDGQCNQSAVAKPAKQVDSAKPAPELPSAVTSGKAPASKKK